jgi:hypothetical protein
VSNERQHGGVGKKNPHRLAAQEPMGVTNSSAPITGRATERYQVQIYHDWLGYLNKKARLMSSLNFGFILFFLKKTSSPVWLILAYPYSFTTDSTWQCAFVFRFPFFEKAAHPFPHGQVTSVSGWLCAGDSLRKTAGSWRNGQTNRRSCGYLNLIQVTRLWVSVQEKAEPWKLRIFLVWTKIL